jgi:hypothetical protein
MDLIKIRDKYNNGDYRYKGIANIPRKYPEDYVFDEELTVKRNREMVIEHNQKVDQLRKEERERQLELDKQLTSDVINYIKENYELNDKQAAIVESYVYQEKHSFMCDYFSCIDSFAEFAESINSGKGEN